MLTAKSTVRYAFTDDDEDLLITLASQAATALETAELIKQREFLQEISSSISVAKNLDDALEAVVDGATKIVEADSGVLHIFDEKGEKILRTYALPLDGPHKQTRFAEKKGLTWQIYQKGKPISVPDVSNNKSVNKALMKELDAQALIGVPLKLEEKIVGTLFLNHKQIHDFSKGEFALLSTLADNAAIAVDNLLLVERIKKQKELQVQALNEISASISAQLELNDVLDGIVDWLRALIGVPDLCEIRWYDKERNILVSKAPKGKNIERRTKESAVGIGITGWLVEQILHGTEEGKKEYVYVPDVTQDGRYLKGIEGTRTELAIPLVERSGSLFGIINIEHSDVNAYDKGAIAVSIALARLAVVAIENAQLFDQLTKVNEKLDYLVNRKIKDLNAVLAMGQALTASVDLDEGQVVNLIHKEISLLMYADNMYIALYDKATDMVSFPLIFVDGEEKKMSSRKAGAGRTEHIIRTKEPLFIETREKSKKWYAQPERDEYLGDPLASWVGVPMVSGDQVIGVVAAYHRTDDYVYSKDDLEVIQAIANQSAIALEVTKKVAELKASQNFGSVWL